MHRLYARFSLLYFVINAVYGSVMPSPKDLAGSFNSTISTNGTSESQNGISYDCRPFPGSGLQPLSFSLCRSAVESFRYSFETENILMSHRERTDFKRGVMQCPYSNSTGGCTFTIDFQENRYVTSLLATREYMADIGHRLVRTCVRGGEGSNPDWGVAIDTEETGAPGGLRTYYNILHTPLEESNMLEQATSGTISNQTTLQDDVL